MDMNAVDSVQYQQWTKTDQSNLITIVQTVEEFLEEFIAMLTNLKYMTMITLQKCIAILLVTLKLILNLMNI